MRVLDATSRFEPVVIVGFNESRGNDLFNTVMMAHKGHLLGKYSKCAKMLQRCRAFWAGRLE